MGKWSTAKDTVQERVERIKVAWKATQFSSTNQPDPAAKLAWAKAGRERKRAAQELMDLVSKYRDLTLEQINEMVSEENIKKLTVKEIICLKYVQEAMNWKLVVDMFDRHVPKAPQTTWVWESNEVHAIEFIITEPAKENNIIDAEPIDALEIKTDTETGGIT